MASELAYIEDIDGGTPGAVKILREWLKREDIEVVRWQVVTKTKPSGNLSRAIVVSTIADIVALGYQGWYDTQS